MTDIAALVADLVAESESADGLVAELAEDRWAAPTPAPGWTVAHQVAHLAWTDRQALLAATDEEAFADTVRQAQANPTGFVDEAAEQWSRQDPAELLAEWRLSRTELAQALATVPSGQKLPWFGPPMAPASMATARIMETWAHGQDIADTLGVRREPTARLRHVAHIGVRAMGFAFQINGLPKPAEPIRVELTGPDGEAWTWNDEGAANRITGPALDFCYLVTQRRHLDDLDITATGPVAEQFLRVAQAFAGLPGAGRKPGEFL
ncbi:TIGR03084 family metal-binding protein [Kutzneria sp. CA-103260]|uniref:TIGR03084 family metal-binding protein n=1 Tax=Kutzneria sp. CA-103260 TaxID=2802641 RepID=UPI001BA847C4|nr:TIGR03084 family metal-binding protein [Kutzneria sp. CA-103260]QUQ66856.1 TIGR03084 family protein [Kutzneria sp. CA-103260]